MNAPRHFFVWLFPALLVVAHPVTAQPRWNVSAGYQAVHLPDTWAAAGVNLDVAFERSEMWSVIGEFGVAHDGDSPSEPEPHDFNLYNIGGGVRWSHRGAAMVPFVQVIAGIHISDSDTDTDRAFMLQPGGGVLIPLSHQLGVSAQLDYRPVFYREDVVQQFRVVAGVRWSPGR